MNGQNYFKTSLFICLAILLMLSFSSVGFSGFFGTTGKIAGRVVDDSNGQPLPGVNVIVEGATLGAATDNEGYFTIVNVPPGTHTVIARMMGYGEVRHTNVKVSVDLTATINFKLKVVALVGEEVVVVAERPMVVKDQTASSTRIDAEMIEDIPNVTTVDEAIALMPGIVGEGEQIHARGGRSSEIVWMVDGIEVSDVLFASQRPDINKYSIQEVEMLSGGYNAEYGNASSGVVNIVTRSGGSKYTGRIANFSDHIYHDLFSSADSRYPSDILNVANPLDVLSRDVFYIEKAPNIRRNTFHADRWEFTLGGPEPVTNKLLPALGFAGLKDKVTFFLSGTADRNDGWRPNEDQSAELTHYTEMFVKTDQIVDPGEADSVWYVNPVKVKNPFVQKFLGFDWGGRQSNNLNLSARLSYRVNNNINMSLSYLNSQFWRDGSANGEYRFMQDHTTQSEGRNYSVVLNWNHSLNAKSFYSVKLGVLNNYRLSYSGMRNGVRYMPEEMNLRLFDGPDGLSGLDRWFESSALSDPNDSTAAVNFDTADELAGFIDPRSNSRMSGQDDNWAEHFTKTYTLKADYLTQINRWNEVKVGLEWRYNNLRQAQIEDAGSKVLTRRINPTDDGRAPTAGSGRDFYTRYPNIYNAYIQDKVEFESLILNIGIRYDRFDPGTNVFEIGEAFIAPTGKENKVVNDKKYFSPRLGFAFPLTDRSRLYFFYGRFIQFPEFRNLYQRQNQFRTYQNQLNTYGNPDLEAEETTSYEIGFDHQLTDEIKFGITGFYKEIENQISTEIFGNEVDFFRKFVNRDFGSHRGFEFDIDKRYGHYFGGTINYTIMWANLRASTFGRGVAGVPSENYPQLLEIPANWDQRHTINANIHFEIPAGRGFNVFGVPIDRVSLNVFWRFWTGSPWTIDANVDPVAEENTQRLPYSNTVNIRFKKDFRIINNLFTTFYLDVNNLFDRRNIVGLNGTERHRVLEYNGVSYPHGNVEGDGSVGDLNPGQLSPPRQILLGFGLRF